MEITNKMIDMTGQRVGKLLVISAAFVENETVYWNCLCDCGNEKTIAGSSLRRKRRPTNSCGCLQIESQSSRRGQKGRQRKSQDDYVYSSILHAITTSAKERNIEYSLKREELLSFVFLNCFYCDSPPANKIKSNRIGSEDIIYTGLDRIDSAIGYHFFNIVPCCIKCNKAKNCMTQIEFYNWILQVINNITATNKINYSNTTGINFTKIWD